MYLPITEVVYFCPARMYSANMVNTTVVRLRAVYIGTFTPRTEAIVASFTDCKKEKEMREISGSEIVVVGVLC